MTDKYQKYRNILGVRQDASSDELGAAYSKVSRIYRHGDPDLERVKEAYKALLDREITIRCGTYKPESSADAAAVFARASRKDRERDIVGTLLDGDTEKIKALRTGYDRPSGRELEAAAEEAIDMAEFRRSPHVGKAVVELGVRITPQMIKAAVRYASGNGNTQVINDLLRVYGNHEPDGMLFTRDEVESDRDYMNKTFCEAAEAGLDDSVALFMSKGFHPTSELVDKVAHNKRWSTVKVLLRGNVFPEMKTIKYAAIQGQRDVTEALIEARREIMKRASVLDKIADRFDTRKTRKFLRSSNYSI